MGVLLEIKAGVAAGKVIALKKGQSVTVGRAAGKAEFALPQDTFMSGLHFAVECSASGCRVLDRKSSNGTFLNGAKIQDAMLANGDEIKAGQTVFHVKIVADDRIATMTLPEPPLASPAARPARPEPPSPPPGPPVSREAEAAARNRGVGPAKPERPKERVSEPRAVEPVRPADEKVRPHAEKLRPVEEPPVELPGKIDAPSAEPPPSRSEDFWATPEAEKASFVDAQRGHESASPRVAFNKASHAEAERAGGLGAPVAERPLERSALPRLGKAGDTALRVMGWSFPLAPAGWSVQEGFGLQSTGSREFPSSVAATEEGLAGITLQQFVESQISMLRGYLRDARIEPIVPPRIEGADETMGVDVRRSTKDGMELAYRHIYARSGSSAGVLTVTTLASEFQQVIESLQPMLQGAAFRATTK